VLLDHLIRPLQERLRDRQAEGLGGREVDDEFESGRLPEEQVFWLRACEDGLHVSCRLPIPVVRIRALAY